MNIREIEPITLASGTITLVRWLDGHTYESDTGATYYSGAAEPDAADAEDCIANPRTPPAAPPQVPAEVPMWALRAILDLAGLTAQIDAILAQLPEPDKTIVLRVWEYGNYLRRDSPTIESLRQALGKTPAEVDGYFAAAAQLNP